MKTLTMMMMILSTNFFNLRLKMGRIKTKPIKRVTKELMERHGDKFTDDFNKNKVIVGRYAEIPSKKLRNTIAGYTTRLVKKGKEDVKKRAAPLEA